MLGLEVMEGRSNSRCHLDDGSLSLSRQSDGFVT